MRIARFSRAEFVAHRFAWNRGEHAFFCEPTQQGKTYLIYQLIERVLAEYEPGQLSFAALMPKPSDPATHEWAQRIGLKETPDFPPLPGLPFQRKPPGYVVWPKHLKNVPRMENRKHVGGILRKCLVHQFWSGNSLTLADDAHAGAVMYGLNPDFEEHLTNGGGMGSSLWVSSQKPSGSAATGSLTTFAYSAPTHLFFGHDPVETNLTRFKDIGGVNPEIIADVVRGLPIHTVMTPTGPKHVSEKLYLHKGGYMCVVGI